MCNYVQKKKKKRKKKKREYTVIIKGCFFLIVKSQRKGLDEFHSDSLCARKIWWEQAIATFAASSKIRFAD